jgi:hypothetical protein
MKKPVIPAKAGISLCQIFQGSQIYKNEPHTEEEKTSEQNSLLFAICSEIYCFTLTF